MAKFLTFGEIMLRLKAPGQERFFQSPMLEATFGGGEANVAVSLANYGQDVGFLTVLPDNPIGDECVKERGGRVPHPAGSRPHGHLLPGGRRQPAAQQGGL